MCVCEKKRIERGKFFDYEGCCGCCLNASRWPSSRPTPSHGLIRSVWFSLSFGCFLFWLYTLYWCMVFSFAEMWLYEEILEFFFSFLAWVVIKAAAAAFVVCFIFWLLWYHTPAIYRFGFWIFLKRVKPKYCIKRWRMLIVSQCFIFFHSSRIEYPNHS